MLKAISSHVFPESPAAPRAAGRLCPQRVHRASSSLRRASTSTTPAARTSASSPSGSVPIPSKPFRCTRRSTPIREMGRGGAPAVNVMHPEKIRRIDAMDEIKRALEVAEQIPLPLPDPHLGEREDTLGAACSGAFDHRARTSARLCKSARREAAGGESPERCGAAGASGGDS